MAEPKSVAQKLQQAASLQNGPKLPDWPYIGKITDVMNKVKQLGSGSGGTVYLAQDKQDPNAYFAAKVITATSEWNDREWLALERLRLASACVESGVICHRGHFLVDVPTSTGLSTFPLLLTDYVKGQDMYDFIESWWRKNKKAPPLDLAMAVIESCIRALATVHAAGLAHRDIKPENMMIQHSVSVDETTKKQTHKAHCVIVDFAYACDVTSCVNMQFSGTPCYASASRLKRAMRYINGRSPREETPEAALKRGQAGDVWAMGLTLFFFLTGHQPWPCIVLDSVEAAGIQYPDSFASLEQFAKRYSLLEHERLPIGYDNPEIAQLLQDMLVTNDKERITAAEAIARLANISRQ